MGISPIPIRTDFLEKDSQGKPTGKVSWPWVKWLMEQGTTPPPFDPDSILALTIEEGQPTDVSEEAASQAVLPGDMTTDLPGTLPESVGDLESIAGLAVEAPPPDLDEAASLGGLLADPVPPPLELVDGQFVKSQSVTTGSIPASSYASVTLTWTTPFWDANYLVHPSVLQAVASQNTLRVHHIESISATQVVVGVYNDDAGGAHTGALHILGIHG
jgi:hypothetical protein